MMALLLLTAVLCTAPLTGGSAVSLRAALLFDAGESRAANAAAAAAAELAAGVSYVHPLFFGRIGLANATDSDDVVPLDVSVAVRTVDREAGNSVDAFRAAQDAIVAGAGNAADVLVGVLPPHLAAAAALAAEQAGVPALVCSPGAAPVGAAAAGLAAPMPVARWEGEVLEELAQSALCWRSVAIVHGSDAYAQGVVKAFLASTNSRSEDARVRVLANVSLSSPGGAAAAARQVVEGGHSRVVVALHDGASARALADALEREGAFAAPYAYVLASRAADAMRSYGKAPPGALGIEPLDSLPNRVIDGNRAVEEPVQRFCPGHALRYAHLLDAQNDRLNRESACRATPTSNRRGLVTRCVDGLPVVINITDSADAAHDAACASQAAPPSYGIAYQYSPPPPPPLPEGSAVASADTAKSLSPAEGALQCDGFGFNAVYLAVKAKQFVAMESSKGRLDCGFACALQHVSVSGISAGADVAASIALKNFFVTNRSTTLADVPERPRPLMKLLFAGKDENDERGALARSLPNGADVGGCSAIYGGAGWSCIVAASEARKAAGATCSSPWAVKDINCAPGYERIVSDEGGERARGNCSICPKDTYKAAWDLDEGKEDETPASCMDCPEGGVTLTEGADSVNKCLCLPGTYRSAKNGACVACPSGALCGGMGAGTSARPGFWRHRSSNGASDDTFLQCANKYACVGESHGSFTPPEGSEDGCAPGYDGPLCALCRDGYAAFPSVWTHGCLKCRPAGVNEFLAVIAVVLGLVFVSLCALVAMTDSRSIADGELTWGDVRHGGGKHVSLKILMDFLQTLALARHIALTHVWPTWFQWSLSTFASMALDPALVLPKCLGATSMMGGLWHEAVAWLFIGLLLCLLPCAAIGGLSSGRPRDGEDEENPEEVSRQHLSELVSGVFVAMLYFAHLPLTEAAIGLVGCTLEEAGLRGGSRFAAALDTRCEAGENPAWIVMGAIMLLVFAFGLPATFGAVILGGVDELRENPGGLGLLCLGYRPEACLWSLAPMARKLLLLTMTASLNLRGAQAQCIGALVILFPSALLHAYARPLITAKANRLELLSVGVTSLVVFAGLCASADDPTKHIEGDRGEERMQWLGALCMIASLLLIIVLLIHWYLGVGEEPVDGDKALEELGSLADNPQLNPAYPVSPPPMQHPVDPYAWMPQPIVSVARRMSATMLPYATGRPMHGASPHGNIEMGENAPRAPDSLAMSEMSTAGAQPAGGVTWDSNPSFSYAQSSPNMTQDQLRARYGVGGNDLPPPPPDAAPQWGPVAGGAFGR